MACTVLWQSLKLLLLQMAYERGWFQSAISKPGMTASPLAVLVATAAEIAAGMAYLHSREAPCWCAACQCLFQPPACVRSMRGPALLTDVAVEALDGCMCRLHSKATIVVAAA